MKNEESLVSARIDTVIRTIRDERVIIDSDLARIYGIPTYRLNEAVKRNRERFPEDFMFQLTGQEQTALTSNKLLVEKLRELEDRLTQRLDTHEQAIVYVLTELKKLMEPPVRPEPKRRPIGFGREE